MRPSLWTASLSMLAASRTGRSLLAHGWSTRGVRARTLVTKRCARTTKIKATSQDVSSALSSPGIINLHTIEKPELEQILESWGHQKYRAGQILNWVHDRGVESVDDMANIPKKLREDLKKYSKMTQLELDCELVSRDGTRKRAYRLWDGQIIESVLMPYEDGRYTACISSQAGCAQGCVFCATGQMGFSRQLSAEEIFEQVSRFAAELAKDDDGSKKNGRSKRLSNIVFMGMGEPLANYRNVVEAVRRIQTDLGIGSRKITISTVGLVPNIRKLMKDLPQVGLAVSLHCATDEERTALLPANRRNGGLQELMSTLREYIETTGRRITLEWALIEGENDTPETAHNLGRLISDYRLRRDMVHVNVIPLNPTGGYSGGPSGRKRVNDFINILDQDYGIACTPRVRRGIDINAGCGQLKAEVEKRRRKEAESEEAPAPSRRPVAARSDDEPSGSVKTKKGRILQHNKRRNLLRDQRGSVAESERLIKLVKKQSTGTTEQIRKASGSVNIVAPEYDDMKRKAGSETHFVPSEQMADFDDDDWADLVQEDKGTMSPTGIRTSRSEFSSGTSQISLESATRFGENKHDIERRFELSEDAVDFDDDDWDDTVWDDEDSMAEAERLLNLVDNTVARTKSP